MSWTNETKIAFTIFLCAALIGAALMLRESGITGLATEDNANLPPKWIGETNKYVIEQNAPLMLNLAELFSDPEGQVLAFVATEAKDLSIVIDGSQLAIVPEQGFVGERIVTVYASDGEKITHKKIKVEVGELQSLSEGIQPDNESASILESEPTSQPEQSPLPDAGITGGGSIAVTCNSCGDCTACAASPGNTCVLTTGISSSTTCITIGNDNVTINCDGKTITFNTGGGGNDYGITSDSRRNLTIANCTIISASASVSAVPINLYRTNSSLIINNTIKALSTNGIDVRSSFYNVITSNKVNATNPNGNAGIKLRQTSAYNNITANTVLTNGSSVGNVAILADFESPNNTIANNFVVTGGSSSSNYGINSETGDTKIINNSINTTGPSVNHGILLNGGTNSIVANNSILATGTSLAQSGIYVINAMQNVFINNIIRTIGSTKNHGIYIDAGADRNVFLQNTISGNGTDTFAIYIESGVSGSNFSSTIINNTPAWIYTNTNTFSNFSNTTFAMPNGSINILPLIQLNSSQNISKERLNISYNKAFLNSTNLTYFNTSAIITLYGLSYSDPAPVVDYEDDGSYEPCSPSQCSELSYSGGVFVFNTTRFTTYSTQDAGAITSCPVTINMSTTLTQDLVSNDTCITIGNDSIVLDCAGYSISYNAKGSDYKYGIVAVNQNNITVKDCFIRDINASGMAGYGINFTGVNNSIVTNSIILTNGTQFSVGIFLQNSNNNTIANSTINATDSSHNWAIGLISSQNTTIIGNNLVSHGTSANNHGISITGFSHGPIISYNNISISGTSNNWGIFMQYANYAIVSNNTISTNCTTSSNNGLLIQYSDWGNFSSNYISAYGSDKENCGIFTYVSNTLSLYNNYISSNGGANNYGIYAYSGENNTFAFNTINTNGTGFSHGILMNYTKRFNIFSNNIRTNDASSYGIFITYSNSTLLNNTVLNDTVHWLFFDKNTFSNLTNTTFQTPLGSINVIQFMQINESEDITKAKLNITYNKAFLNSSNLTYFNTSAIITLYGLSYSDPKPVVDYGDNGSYEDCPSDVCTELSYSGGVFVFNTTRFTSYSAEESGGGTCGTCFECSSCASTPEASCAVTADLGTSGTCITINASNVVLDCQGHTIVFDKWGMGKASGIMSKDAQNVTVKNCNIMTNHSNGNEDFGINFTNSSGFRIINNSIFVNTTSNNRGISIGMYGSGDSCNGIVENNTVVSIGTGSSNVGLFFASACNSNITGNTILANGTFTSYGISLGSSAGLLFSHNNISVIGDISSYAVAISDCLFSVFNATLLNDSSNWIVCGGVSIDNNFTNTTFATMHGSINILPTFNLTGNIYVGRENLNMSNNRAFVNSTALPFLNSSGIITLENITYSNPRPLVDWNDDYSYEPCPVEVCSELDYAGTRYVFNATHFTGYSSDETGTSCPLTIYQSITLANDLSSLTSCITFGNDSIYLDCNGHIIYYNNGSGSDDRGIIAIGRENITVRNCIIKDPTSGGTNNYAIYLEKVSSSVVVNNTMYANCTTSCNGMVLRNSSEGNIVANNTIITLNQVSYNVEVDNSSTNAIVGNTIIANSSGNTQVGIRLRDSHSSNISYNNISIMGNSNNVCIELRNAENNSIENNTIINYGSGDNNHGMLLWDNSSNNSVVMNAIRASSTGNAIMLDHAGANVFIANWLRGGGNGYALWIEGSSFSSF
ncbi:MAG: right-handed parallel beta-helix repeat-containing protein, partial [Candidatus Woesearchaeota archaeon]